MKGPIQTAYDWKLKRVAERGRELMEQGLPSYGDPELDQLQLLADKASSQAFDRMPKGKELDELVEPMKPRGLMAWLIRIWTGQTPEEHARHKIGLMKIHAARAAAKPFQDRLVRAIGERRVQQKAERREARKARRQSSHRKPSNAATSAKLLDQHTR